MGEAVNLRVKLFYRASIEMPDAVCDNNSDNYDLHVEGVIPIMSFDEAVEKFDNIYVLITSDIYLNEIMKRVMEKVPIERIFYFTPDEIKKYIKEKDYSKSEFYMPKHINKIQDKLKYYQDLYAKGENIKIRTDNFFIKSDEKYVYLVDYMNRDSVKTNGTIESLTRNIYKLKINNNYFMVSKFDTKPKFIHHENDYIKSSIENIVSFNNHLKDKNIPFSYIKVPHIVSSLKGDDFENMYDDANRQVDKLIEGLNENNIHHLDLRDYVMKNNIKPEDWFFRTDFHWAPRAVFEANKVICEYIAKFIDCELNYDYFDIKNYNIKIHKNRFLGSNAIVFGLLHSNDCDDFEIITPKFETDFSLICDEKEYYKRGAAKDVLVLHEQLNFGYYPNISMYSSYSLFHKCYTVVKNHNNKNGIKIFIINDSFSRPLSMFMTQQFEEVHFFDFRQEDFNKKLFEAIEYVNPDMILMIYN